MQMWDGSSDPCVCFLMHICCSWGINKAYPSTGSMGQGWILSGKEKTSVCLSAAPGEAEVKNSGAALTTQQASHVQDLFPPSSSANLGAPGGAQQERMVSWMAAQLCWSPFADWMYRCCSFLWGGEFMFHSSLQGCGDSWGTGKPESYLQGENC